MHLLLSGKSASEARPMIVFHSRFSYVFTDIGIDVCTAENGQAMHGMCPITCAYPRGLVVKLK